RVAESGGGKILDPAHPIVNPFQHDRRKTFQPRDLWEWLLKLAVVLFTFDVAVRRIQLDREEWQKATRTLRRWLFFWNVAPRPAACSKPNVGRRNGESNGSRKGRPGSAGIPAGEFHRTGPRRQGCRRSCACEGAHIAGCKSPSGRRFTGL